LGKEAKYFTELSLLHRDVSLVLEGVDKFENLFGSIVLENNKCFQEELLSKGYATIAEWNVGNSKFSTVMRKAEQDAKKKKLKIFKNFKEPESSLSSEDHKTFQAIVIQVLSGDSLRIKSLDHNGIEERIFLSSIKAPKFKNSFDQKSKYEAWAFESKEALRQKISLSNNLVTVKIDYKKKERKIKRMSKGMQLSQLVRRMLLLIKFKMGWLQLQDIVIMKKDHHFMIS